MNRHPFSLFAAVALAFGLCWPVGAASQDADPEQRGDRNRRAMARDRAIDPDVLEEVVVTAGRIEGSGRRGRATVGRNELDSTDQIDMDSFFDEIDGLSTLGGDGEGNSFSIDGLSADLGLVTLDGQGFGQGRGNGGFGAGDLPPEMIRRVDLHKMPAASLEEGGVAGQVNLELRSPVDIPDPSGSLNAPR